MNAYNLIQWHLQIMSWRDGVEILFFSLICYTLTRWLAQDNQKNLLGYFYGYCAVAGAAYALRLSTISACLFISSPVVIMLFMLMHQETLQRNLIALKNIILPSQPTRDWLSLFLAELIKGLNDTRTLFILVEHTDALASYLQVSFELNAPITPGLFDMLTQHNCYEPQSMLWIRSDGSVHGVNARWKTSWTPDGAQINWIDDAILYTEKTDAFFIALNPQDQNYTVVVDGKAHTHITLDHTEQLLRKHIAYPHYSSIKKGTEYGVTKQKERMAQRTP